jgi:hypothetical protein
MTIVAPHQAATETVMMTVVVAAEVMVADVMMITAETIAATVAMAVIVMTATPHAESIDTHAMTGTAAVAEMTVEEAAEATLIVMREVAIVALPLVMSLPHPTMVIPLLVERLESHTEVDNTRTMTDTTVVNIDR